MVAFTPIVQADFSGTAFGGVPTWTDITRFARLGPSPISIRKWRQDQLSDVAPSTMTLVLDNAELLGDATAPNAGRFTPFLTSSPWSPHILPGVRIRAGVTVNAVTYWRFDGYVDVWDASYDNGEFGICTVTASDILARLGSGDPLRTMYVEECLTDTPFVVYPLTDPAGAASAGDVSGNTAPSANAKTNDHGDLAWATATGLPTDGSSTLTMNGTLTTAAGDDLAGMFLETDSSVAATFAGTTLEAWVTLGATLASSMSRLSAPVALVSTIGNNGVLSDLKLSLVYNAGSIQLQDWTGAAVGPNLNDGRLHHIVVTASTATVTNNYYVDGALVSSSAVSQQLGGGYLQLGGVSRASQGGTGTVFPPFRGGFGYAAIYPTQLSAGRVTAHYNAGKTAFAGEGTATHISRLLTYRKNLGATLDSGQGTVAAQPLAGVSGQQALLDTAKAEGGLLYADPATGKIVFLDRTHLRNPASVLTLDITAQQTTPDLNVRGDRDLLLNDVTISRPGGVTARKIDQTSKNTYGTRGLSETRIIGSDQDVANASGWLVANGKDVRARTPALSVDLLTEPSLTVAAGVLNLVPLQRVSLTNPPASMAASDVIVQGCTDTIGVDVFECAFFVSPMPRPTLRFDAVADSFTKLDSGNVFAW